MNLEDFADAGTSIIDLTQAEACKDLQTQETTLRSKQKRYGLKSVI